MSISDIITAISNAPRTGRFLSAIVAAGWSPGTGNQQIFVDPELAASMIHEADTFLDRAVVLFLIRRRLRATQALTWSDVSVYYSNYFAAAAVSRLALRSITFVHGDVYKITPTAPMSFQFSVRRSSAFASHRQTWDMYYDAVAYLAWPDPATISLLAPVIHRHRERMVRDAVNYTPGRGFLEIHRSAGKYKASTKHLATINESTTPIDNSAFLDVMALRRLRHAFGLVHEIQKGFLSTSEIASIRKTRELLIRRYSTDIRDTEELLIAL